MREGITYKKWKIDEKGNISEGGIPFKTASFCEEATTVDEYVLSYCTLGACAHPVCVHTSLDGLVTFHANYIVGRENNIQRLKELDLWNTSCKLDPSGN